MGRGTWIKKDREKVWGKLEKRLLYKWGLKKRGVVKTKEGWSKKYIGERRRERVREE